MSRQFAGVIAIGRTVRLCCCLVLFVLTLAMAEENGPSNTDNPDAKHLRGMSVLGNNEAPMALFIVPWKSSELGGETSLSRTLNERDLPVDREVFLRELDFYQLSTGTLPAKNGQK